MTKNDNDDGDQCFKVLFNSVPILHRDDRSVIIMVLDKALLQPKSNDIFLFLHEYICCGTH